MQERIALLADPYARWMRWVNLTFFKILPFTLRTVRTQGQVSTQGTFQRVPGRSLPPQAPQGSRRFCIQQLASEFRNRAAYIQMSLNCLQTGRPMADCPASCNFQFKANTAMPSPGSRQWCCPYLINPYHVLNEPGPAILRRSHDVTITRYRSHS